MNNAPQTNPLLPPSSAGLDGFIVQVGLDDIEVRGANIYRLPDCTDALIVMPVFPPLFYNGSLRCEGGCLKWFIDTDRNIYIIDFTGKSAVRINGEWVYISAPAFTYAINTCISFFEWLDAEAKRIGKDDELISVLIAINDEDTSHLPLWFTEMPSFAAKWYAYKACYKALSCYTHPHGQVAE